MSNAKSVPSCFVLIVVPVKRLHAVNTAERYLLLGRLEVNRVHFGPPYLTINFTNLKFVFRECK
jgi:hypothetical protein